MVNKKFSVWKHVRHGCSRDLVPCAFPYLYGQVEMKLTNTFQKLATKIEGLRSDPNSPEETKRREWMEKTLKDYEPVRALIFSLYKSLDSSF